MASATPLNKPPPLNGTITRSNSKTYRLPGSRLARMAIGIILIVGGILGFLPILGFWMVPLGLLVLSADSARIRRLRRRVEVWWGRKGKEDVSVSVDDLC